MAVFENSRYLHTAIHSRFSPDETQVFKIRDIFKFNKEICTTYIWTQGDTLDGVANRLYGISALRWAILDANPKYRTEFEIEEGDMLSIPDYDEVVDLVNV